MQCTSWTKTQPFNQDQEGGVTIKVARDREGLLDFKRGWKVGGQGPHKPLRFTPCDPDELSNGQGRITDNVERFLQDNPGPHSLRAIRTSVKVERARH